MYCSFCKKADHLGEVNYVVCGPTVYICDDCISTSVFSMGEVIAEQRRVIRDLVQLIRQYEIGALHG